MFPTWRWEDTEIAIVLGSGMGEFAVVVFSGSQDFAGVQDRGWRGIGGSARIGKKAGGEGVVSSACGSVDERGGISDRWAVEGSILGRCYIAPLGLGRAFGSTGRRRVAPRWSAASVGPAVGVGVAVGIEVRSALHQSAGATAGFRIGGP